jgi:RES domain-containing protein
MNAWRLTKRRHAKDAFTGKGAADYGGRWNKKKTAIVYTSENLSLALLEILKNAKESKYRAYFAFPITIPDELVETLEKNELPADWRAEPCPVSTQELGTKWAKSMKSLALRVPSRFVPMEYNLLINPKHKDFKKVIIGKPKTFNLQADLLN